MAFVKGFLGFIAFAIVLLGLWVAFGPGLFWLLENYL